MADHGHSFAKKTFHKPTYCHHCTDMLWGLLQQGYICEGKCHSVYMYCTFIYLLIFFLSFFFFCNPRSNSTSSPFPYAELQGVLCTLPLLLLGATLNTTPFLAFMISPFFLLLIHIYS